MTEQSRLTDLQLAAIRDRRSSDDPYIGKAQRQAEDIDALLRECEALTVDRDEARAYVSRAATTLETMMRKAQEK